MLKYDTFNPDPYGAHMRMIKLTGRNKVVLDVGCATGQVARRLKENRCEVVGIEIDKESAQIAKRYCKAVIVGDIETIDSLPYPEEYFDVIIFGDVLEHLKDPLSVLKKLKKHLNKSRWEYQDTGILDKTHLRFFTKKTAIKLIEDAGYKIEELYYTPWIPLLRLGRFKFGRKIEYYLTKALPTLFTLQFVIKARR